MNTRLILLLVAVIIFPSFLRADDQGDAATTESRLRDALRSTMVQLRDAQSQLVTLQAAQVQSDKDNADLKAKVDDLTAQIATLTKQSADDKAASDKTIDDLKAQVADQTGQMARLNQSLTEWKAAQKQESDLADAREQARAQLALQVALLQRTVDDRETKNFALYKLGNEILTRYEHYGLGDAISAKEPFVGLSRVKLENLVQGYKDKLLDQTVTSQHLPVLAPPAPAPATAPAKQVSVAPAPVKTPLASSSASMTQP